MKLREAKGHWALVTGASSGIGREFAIKLAASGMNLVLIARRTELLNSLKNDLVRLYEIKVIALPVDLSCIDSVVAIKSHLSEEKIKIRLLINNAASACWGPFEETSYENYVHMINLNTLSMVTICHLYFNDLCSFATSAIINVSSPAGYNPIPYMSVYAATKAFVTSFSQSLYGEWKDHGVLVQTLVPGPTETELGVAASEYASHFKKMGSAEALVKISLAHLEKGSPVVSCAKGTYKQRLFSALFPAKIVIKIVGNLFKPQNK